MVEHHNRRRPSAAASSAGLRRCWRCECPVQQPKQRTNSFHANFSLIFTLGLGNQQIKQGLKIVVKPQSVWLSGCCLCSTTRFTVSGSLAHLSMQRAYAVSKRMPDRWSQHSFCSLGCGNLGHLVLVALPAAAERLDRNSNAAVNCACSNYLPSLQNISL
jgi:hypothetical protein